jgi:hypothetical protein
MVYYLHGIWRNMFGSGYGRAPITMAGGTVFHFVSKGIHVALDLARAAAAIHRS